ncbi:MAG: ISNCY family transposase [Candidatus Eisenbacteria bacterium]|nr:ISNCY family transposase [Candidatus Eisenbacteria bacterium]
MSRKEAGRPGLVQAALDGKITNREGALALGLGVRQFRRLKVKFRAKGCEGLIHGLRGAASPRRWEQGLRDRVRDLALGVYANLNDSHATEKIREVDKLIVGRETVRKLRRDAGLAPKRSRRPPQHRQRRARREQRGSLVLIDGSDHDWFGPDRPRACLVGAIDDATSEILSLVFRPHEDLHGYFELLRRMAVTCGLPVQFYGDRFGVLVRNDAHWSLEEELRGKQNPTEFGRALRELNIGFIEAQSPEAKGRIERLWNTLQDRLVAELALAGITDPEAAEAFLPSFIKDHNRRFAKPPSQAASAFQKPPKDLLEILACRYERVVARDNTVNLPGRWIQLPKGTGGRSWQGRKVEARELLDGRLIVRLEGRVIASQNTNTVPFTLAPRAQKSRRQQLGNDGPAKPRPTSDTISERTTKSKPVRSSKPAPEHPWRRRAISPMATQTP